jgi:hypothetical protein
VEYDRAPLTSNQIHFKMVRLNLAEVAMLSDDAGHSSFDIALKKASSGGAGNFGVPKMESLKFTGIDTLNLTLGAVRYGTVGKTNQDRLLVFGITNQTLTNIRSEKDLMVRMILLAKDRGNLMDDLWQELK